MPTIVRYEKPINKLHQNILDEFGTVTHCARKLGYSNHASIYRMIHNAPTERQIKRLKACGYTAEFTRIS